LGFYRKLSCWYGAIRSPASRSVNASARSLKSPKQIAAAVLDLPEKTLRYKFSPDKWSILEILGHLADMEILYSYRIRQMLADQDPVIAPIDQDAWAKNLGYF
jgi:uncharacterized damage-inducible protein DinB